MSWTAVGNASTGWTTQGASSASFGAGSNASNTWSAATNADGYYVIDYAIDDYVEGAGFDTTDPASNTWVSA